jgi:uncharacterized protein YjbI with pentapeptide repeats
MASYTYDNQFTDILYSEHELNHQEFECCTFTNCNFSQCTFVALTFIDCTFINCFFTSAKINHVALRNVIFEHCEIKDVNFAMCDAFIFTIGFNNCILDFSKFYNLNLKETQFTKCSLIAVDFMNTNLTHAIFDDCDLYKSEFSGANADHTDFKTSYNYSIDPKKTKLKKTLFSKNEVKGLLYQYDLIID